MKTIFIKLLLITGLWLAVGHAQAQSAGGDQVGAVRSAIASGSAHDLAQYLAPSVEVGFDGDKQTYNAAQAELVLKNFFAKNGASSFDIKHQGASGEGIPYAIGQYVGRSGTYRVFIKLKAKQSSPSIDTLDFTKE